MKRILILLVAIFVTFAVTFSSVAQDKAQKTTTTPATPAQTEPTKNEVELAIEEAQKHGEAILSACLHDCEDDVALVKGRALSLPQPPYPPLARRANVSGVVKVHVVVDVDGKVIAAAAVDGHPLLRPASVAAARHARFSPTLYDGRAVKVTGLIEYNFTPK